MTVQNEDLAGASIIDSVLENIGILDADLSAVSFVDSWLRGAVISPEQLTELAPSLAEQLGLTVLDPDGEA